MDKDLKRDWVAALRSGEYVQGHGQLRYRGHYCCLGVLCTLLPNARFVDDDGTAHFEIEDKFEARRCDLPFEVLDLIGLHPEQVDHLIRMNDGAGVPMASFRQIATHIQRNL